MKVADILKVKGAAVITVRPTETIRALAEHLRDERVGAMPVSEDGNTLVGIISERDVAYGLAEHGSQLSTLVVSDLMTTSIVTCSPQDTVAQVSSVMTQQRIRHLPVIEEMQLVGVVSIGDVLKHRLSEKEFEADVLRDIAIARR